MNVSDAIKVALVYDQVIIRNCLQMLLFHWGYNIVLQATNNRDLLQKLPGSPVPDICMLTINIPVLDGYRAIKTLKEINPSIKILVFSPVSSEYTEILQSGADVVLPQVPVVAELKAILEILRG